MKQKIRYWILRILWLWPPKKDKAQQMIYELKDADESYKGRP